MLKNDVEFTELSSDFYNKFNTEKKINSYLKKLKDLGWKELQEPDQTSQQNHYNYNINFTNIQ